MKRICILLVMVGLTALGARAQTVTGSGTTNKIPKFTGSSTIGDSEIFQLNGNIGIGTLTPGLSGFGDSKLEVDSTSDLQGAAGVFGTAISSSEFSAGVRGIHLATTGNTFGVAGISFSVNGVGVHGNHTNPEAQGPQGGGGVSGICESTSGFCFGVQGAATGTTGFAAGGLFSAAAPDGVALVFVHQAGGNLLLGKVAQGGGPQKVVFRVDGNGTIFADGGFRPFGADFAESVAVKGGVEHYVPGDLLVIDASGERRLSLSQTPYSTLVAGIYSTQPGVVASTHRADEVLPNNEVPLAVVGIVPCKVTAESGPIVPGDLLVTSSTPGYAMKGTDRSRMLGAVVGKALQPLQQGTGVIQVLVTLQ